jgi:hypothetical protein
LFGILGAYLGSISRQHGSIVTVFYFFIVEKYTLFGLLVARPGLDRGVAPRKVSQSSPRLDNSRAAEEVSGRIRKSLDPEALRLRVGE